MTMVKIETMAGFSAQTVRPADLSVADIEAWRGMIASQPAFANPLLGPDFAQMAGAVRPDAFVTVWRQNDTPVAFLAHQRTGGGPARPIGGPLSDYHALISGGRLDGPALLGLAGLPAWRYTANLDPYGLFPAAATTREAHLIALDAATPAAAEGYLETIRAASAKKFKNYRRLGHALEREVGEIRVIGPDHDQAAFDQLLAWKREQLNRTGVFDFLKPAWTGELLQAAFDRREGDLQGLMICLYAGDRLAAGQFGVRVGGYFHPWIASVDPGLSDYSPGQLFLTRAIEVMPALGLNTYDLGPSHDHYKRPYALSQVMVGEDVATARNAAGALSRAVEEAWVLAGARRGGFAGKVRRRLDVIAATESSAAGRWRGVLDAAAKAARPARDAALTT
jgi:CelD/BcsL family acetyltransferase involved in cellulose biosynthesis